jgi:hypothetical protein
MSDERTRRPRAHWLLWVFAVVGLICILSIAVMLATSLGLGGRYEPPKVATRDSKIEFSLGNVAPLRGTSLIRIAIDASESGGGGSSAYSGGGGPDTRNILLLDRATGNSRKLLPDESRHILHSRFLSERGEGLGDDSDALMGGDEDPGPAAYYLLTVSGGERGAAQDVLAGRLGDGRQAYVMRGIDGIDAVWMQNPTRIGLLVREKLGLYYRIVDVGSLKVVQSKPVAID